ncbi:hypothetical protein [Hymenobacter sp. B1770]|uniref:hypothetical protein n=1 Tax=Hymenobacter sp. B1770 TaxID=1718788 RepID=UPI003CF12ADD
MQPLPFILLAALLSSAQSIAQPTYRVGLRGGINRATTTLDPASNSQENGPFRYSAEKSAIYAWQAGQCWK